MDIFHPFFYVMVLDCAYFFIFISQSKSVQVAQHSAVF